MTGGTSFKDELLLCIPALRAFAMALARKRDFADDLVQEALVRAWEHQDQFIPGTNLRAWLFTILRNRFLNSYRSKKYEAVYCRGFVPVANYQKPEQIGVVALGEFKDALEKLPVEQREALVLLTIGGLPVEEIALICGVAAGTIKSRIHRARTKLQAYALDDADLDFGIPPIQVPAAALQLH